MPGWYTLHVIVASDDEDFIMSLTSRFRGQDLHLRPCTSLRSAGVNLKQDLHCTRPKQARHSLKKNYSLVTWAKYILISNGKTHYCLNDTRWIQERTRWSITGNTFLHVTLLIRISVMDLCTLLMTAEISVLNIITSSPSYQEQIWSPTEKN